MENQNSNTTLIFEDFCSLVKTAYQNGDNFILVWKNEEERAAWCDNEEKVFSLKTVFEYIGQFRLTSARGNGIAAMGFKIENLLTYESNIKFTHGVLVFNHLKGPIVSIPSCRVIG